jgi:hypothetical protein
LRFSRFSKKRFKKVLKSLKKQKKFKKLDFQKKFKKVRLGLVVRVGVRERVRDQVPPIYRIDKFGRVYKNLLI